jgi:hypothetical protein
MTDWSQEKRQDAIRIKREREEESQAGDTTLLGDDEVQWTRSQPKKVCHDPRAKDEVVALDC